MSTIQGSYRADPELRARIQAFSPDEPGVAFPFSARLAQENGWTREYALAVTREYLRFVYLAMTAGHPVTPSLAVDEAWHLHLTYTRSYWEEMCGRVLGRPLHHDPTRGGTAEEAKFASWYARTLATYHAAFGEEPPAEIWPRPQAEAAAPPTAPAARSGGFAIFAVALLAAVLTGAFVGPDAGGVFIVTIAVVVATFTVYVVREVGRTPRLPRARGGNRDGGMGWVDGGGASDGGGHHGHAGSHHDGGGHHGACSGHSGCSGHGGCGHGGCGHGGCGSGH
jgi:hypothetical protein